MKFAIIGFVVLALAGATVGVLGFLGVVKIPGITPKKTAATKKQLAPQEAAKTVPPKRPSAVAAKPKSPGKSVVKPPARVDPEAEKKIDRLASMYEQLPAEEAGPIFAKLPDALVEKLLRKMDDRQAGKVLLVLGTQRAAKLTMSLAK